MRSSAAASVSSGWMVMGFSTMPEFEALDEPHLLGLRAGLEVAVDDAEPAVLGHGDRHLRFGDRVHRRGDDRDVESDRAGEPRPDRDIGGQHLGVAGPQQHVVEGQAFDELIG